MVNKIHAPKDGETYEDYGMRLYRNSKEYGLTNEIIGFLLNDFKGVNWDESAHRKKMTERIKGFDKGYNIGLEEGINKYKKEVSNGNIDIDGINSIIPKTHLKKLSNMIGEYNIIKTEVAKEQRILRKYMRQATPAVLLAEQYRESLQNNEIQLRDINNFKLEDFNNTVIKVALSDFHVGLVIEESYNEYNFEIAKERLNKFKKEILYLAKMNNSNKISITMLGDAIEGFSMRAEQPFDIEFTQSQQIEKAQQLIYDFCIDFVNKGYYVELSGISGNHDIYRITNHGRNSLPDDNAVRTIFKNLQLISKVSNNDKFYVHTQDKFDEFSEEINGVIIKYVHGDDEVKNDSNKMQKHSSIMGKQVNILLMGHLHHYRAVSRNRNEFEIYCGALTGANDYAKKKVKQIANASQTVLIIREDGTYYSLNVDLQKVEVRTGLLK